MKDISDQLYAALNWTYIVLTDWIEGYKWNGIFSKRKGGICKEGLAFSFFKAIFLKSYRFYLLSIYSVPKIAVSWKRKQSKDHDFRGREGTVTNDSIQWCVRDVLRGRFKVDKCHLNQRMTEKALRGCDTQYETLQRKEELDRGGKEGSHFRQRDRLKTLSVSEFGWCSCFAKCCGPGGISWC